MWSPKTSKVFSNKYQGLGYEGAHLIPQIYRYLLLRAGLPRSEDLRIRDLTPDSRKLTRRPQRERWSRVLIKPRGPRRLSGFAFAVKVASGARNISGIVSLDYERGAHTTLGLVLLGRRATGPWLTTQGDRRGCRGGCMLLTRHVQLRSRRVRGRTDSFRRRTQ